MKRLRIPILAALSVILLSGCLQVRTVVTVNRDGSGTLEETFILKQEIQEMLAGFSPDGAGIQVMDQDRLRDQAAGMGEGVVFVSAEPLKTRVGQGYRAVYRFDDINSLRVNQNPGGKMPQTGMGDPGAEEIVTFSFRTGSTSELIIHLPEPGEEEMDLDEEDMDFEEDISVEVDGEAAEFDEFEETMEESTADNEFFDKETIRDFYRDMRISFEIRVGGSIVDTNASYARGSSTVVLMDMDFNRILADADAMDRLMNEQNQSQSLEEMKALVNSIAGIDVEMEREVSVRFR